MATTTYGSPYVAGTDLVANWPAASLTVANAIDAAGYFIGRGINTQIISYTTVLTDAGKTVTMSNAAATTITIPANSSVAYVTGTRIQIVNLGAGATTPTAGVGVTISGTIAALTANQSAELLKTGTNTWSYVPGAVAATSGLTLINTTTFSAASTVSVNNCFTSTYENYRIMFYASTASGNVFQKLRMRAAGADDTSANYADQNIDAAAASVTGARVSGATSNTCAFASTTGGWASIDIFRPQIAAPTYFHSSGGLVVASPAAEVFVGGHNVSTAYDGLTIFPASSTITGTLRVYGYQN